MLKHVTLHARTVQKAAELEGKRMSAVASKRAKKAAQTRKKNRTLPIKQIETIKPDLRVWETALAHAHGNVNRIRVISATEVIVYNSPELKKKAR